MAAYCAPTGRSRPSRPRTVRSPREWLTRPAAPLTALEKCPWALADHEHGPVGQVDHLVRGAAQDQPGQVTAATRAHDDGADLLGPGLRDDLAGGVAVDRVPHDAVRVPASLGQCGDRGVDVLLDLVDRLRDDQAGPGHDLPLAQVQDPY